MNVWRTAILYAVLGLLTVSQTGAQSIPNYEGMWAAPGEPGWGMSFTHQGDIIFATSFSYGDGNPEWSSMTAQQQSDGSFAGFPWLACPFMVQLSYVHRLRCTRSNFDAITRKGK